MLDHWMRPKRRRAEPLLRQLVKDKVATVSLVGLAQRAQVGEPAARQLASRMSRRGELTRVLPGLYRVNEVAQAPDLLAHAIRWAAGDRDHWLSYGTAMAAYGAGLPLPHPVLRISCSSPVRSRVLPDGTQLHFITAPEGLPVHLDDVQVAGIGTVPLAAPETVVIESLKRPQHAGGVLTLAKFLKAMRGRIDPERVVADALELGSGAVIRRAGFLLELAGASRTTVEPLRARLNETFALLDPTAPAGGYHLEYWKLRLNVQIEDVQKALGAAA